eukprot:m.264424 g.264424  ORF g.264424 m.264424 type:complete len:65 (-) comp16231_c0_seq2:192-386(-)
MRSRSSFSGITLDARSCPEEDIVKDVYFVSLSQQTNGYQTYNPRYLIMARSDISVPGNHICSYI